MNQERELGSFGLWLLKLLIPLLWLAMIGVVVAVDGFRRFAIAMLLFLAAGVLGADSIAYGCASEKGVTFRRYVKQRYLPWEKVAALRWIPTVLLLYLKEGPLLRRKLDFPSISPWPWTAVAQLLGRTTPEIVSWLDQQMKVERSDFPRWRFGYYSWKDSVPVWLALFLMLAAIVYIQS